MKKIIICLIYLFIVTSSYSSTPQETIYSGTINGSEDGGDETFKDVFYIKYNIFNEPINITINETSTDYYGNKYTNKQTVKIDYEKEIISMEGSDNKDIAFKLNTDGYITEIVDNSYPSTYTYTYNDEGYMTNYACLTNNKENTISNLSYTWLNDNMSTAKGISEEASINGTFSYDSQIDINHITPSFHTNFLKSPINHYSFGDLVNDIFFSTGLFGKSSSKLIKKLSAIINNEIYQKNFAYNFDSNSNVSSVSYTDNDGDSGTMTLSYQDQISGIKTTNIKNIEIHINNEHVIINGLENNEIVKFYTTDGKEIGKTVSINGTATFLATTNQIIIAKIRNLSYKIAVK